MKASLSNKISIVIPFLNEEENIPDLVDQLLEMEVENQNLVLEFIFVDDGSLDDSVKLLVEKMPVKKDWKLIKLSRNYGSYNALRVGVLHATHDIVTFLYADLQDPVSLIPQMYKKLSEGFDLVIAERGSTNNKFSERFFSELHARIIKKFIADSFPNKGFDVVMFSSQIKERLNSNVEADSNVFLQILKSGFKQGRITYEKVERTKGKTKWSLGAKIKASIDVLVSFSYLPVRLISLAGIIFTLISILMMLGAGIAWWMENIVDWWKISLVSLILLCFGVTNIALGLLGEYLWRILNAARKRPAFTVDEIIDNSKKEEPG